MSEFPAFAHVAVTVTDLERSTQWYSALFDASRSWTRTRSTGGFHHTVYVIGGGELFGLHTHPQGAGDKFSELQTGLDHVSFGCRDRNELQDWAARLDQLGITHGGIVDAPLRVRRVVPRPRRHRTRVLRAAGLTRRCKLPKWFQFGESQTGTTLARSGLNE